MNFEVEKDKIPTILHLMLIKLKFVLYLKLVVLI